MRFTLAKVGLPGGCSVSVLLGSPPADLPSWSATAAASDDDIHRHLPVAAQDRHGSVQRRHSAVQAVW